VESQGRWSDADAAQGETLRLRRRRPHHNALKFTTFSISNNGTEKLFDLRVDPDERRSLAAVPEHSDRVKTMQAAVVDAWRGDVVTEASTSTAPRQKAKKTRNTASKPEE
jgi:hypothetical protein